MSLNYIRFIKFDANIILNFDLSKEKQKNIIDASTKEFKRVLLKDASINKIIKDANISRGSFYNYFNDINDLYMYSLNNYKKHLFEMFNKILIKTDGDLIESTKLIFDKIIKETSILSLGQKIKLR